MPMNKRNTRTVCRTTYAGLTETVTLLKRGDDQQQGTVTSYLLFRCRRGQISRTGEPLQGDWDVAIKATWHIPKSELDRIGIKHLNALDRIIEAGTIYWQPDAETTIGEKLLGNEVDLECSRCDPPKNPQ